MTRNRTRTGGFTLVELLVALLVFSLLAVMGYRGLTALLQTRTQLDLETRKYETLSRFFVRLDGQVAQAIARPIRLADGTEQAAWVGFPPNGGGLEDARLMFTRAGGVDAEGMPIAPQRLGYRLHDRQVQLLRWNRLDRAPNDKPLVDDVLDGVKEFNLRHLSSASAWTTQWPAAVSEPPLPKGVEVELVLVSGEKVVRFFSLQ
ncbi:MAG TPA: type II secretion system minor pseudopilin GspJ [Sideroxyarcus sp.]|nr:type II secretion system minor pseudopilin GspJ [Sideroxyarcus sp.]